VTTVGGKQSARVTVAGVSKRFSKDLRSSLRYGMQDIMGELNPFSRPKNGLRPHEFWALKDVSFKVGPGESIALLGDNGAGKSSLLKLLNGVMTPDAGEIRVAGRVSALIELGTGFHPTLTGRENIQVNAALLGLPKRQLADIVDQIIDFAELGDFVDAPLQDYSSGMWVRLGYAISAHLKPDILLADEVLAVGDLSFRRKCMQHMMSFIDSGGTLILVSHNLYQVQTICRRSIVLHHGQVVFDGDTVEGVKRYFEDRHAAAIQAAGQGGARETVPGSPVRIEAIEITPLVGDELRPNQPARVSIRYQAAEDVERVNWGFSVWAGDLSVCLGAAGNMCGTTSLRPGPGELTGVMPRLPFTAGTYALRATFLEADSGMPLYHFGLTNAPSYISVKSEPSAGNNFLSMSGALMNLDVQWEDSTPEVSTPREAETCSPR
jgi:lipopolysaccharide transport system ATP-binding protein